MTVSYAAARKPVVKDAKIKVSSFLLPEHIRTVTRTTVRGFYWTAQYPGVAKQHNGYTPWGPASKVSAHDVGYWVTHFTATDVSYQVLP